MPDPTPNSSPEDISRSLTTHAAVLWGEEKAAQLQDSITQTAQMLHDIARQFPAGDTEPACYPAAIRNEEAP